MTFASFSCLQFYFLLHIKFFDSSVGGRGLGSFRYTWLQIESTTAYDYLCKIDAEGMQINSYLGQKSLGSESEVCLFYLQK